MSFDFVDASLLFDILVTSKNFASQDESLERRPWRRRLFQSIPCNKALEGADHEGCSWNLKDFAGSKVDTGSF